MKNTKHNGTIYLSGGMEKAVELGGAWRSALSERLVKMGFIPFDITELDRAYGLTMSDPLLSEEAQNELPLKAIMRKHFIEADLDLIRNDTDAVVLLYDESVRRGAGSHSEAQCAYEHDIPLFVVNTYDKVIGEVPKWLIGLSTKVFNHFDELDSYLADLPQGILRRDVYGNHSSGNHYLCSMCGDVFAKSNSHFVSKISPLYCKSCIDLVVHTNEGMANRYEFFKKYLNEKFGV